MLRKLCEKYTLLKSEEVAELEKWALKIEEEELFSRKDVFIDVFGELTSAVWVVFQRNSLSGHSIYQSVNLVGQRMQRESEPGVYRSFETTLSSVGLMGRSPDGQVIIQQAYPLVYQQKTIGVIVVEERASDEWVNERLFQNEETSLLTGNNQIIENYIDVGILYFDQDGYLVKANQDALALYKKFGYLDDISGIHYDNLSMDHSTFIEILKEYKNISTKNYMEKEVKFFSFHFVLRFIFFDDSNSFVLVVKDVSLFKEKELELIEKSEAIQEIHHRIKNNLQTIVSLLRIQLRTLESDKLRKTLKDSIYRILVIANIHDLLSTKVDGKIQLNELIQMIVKNLKEGYREKKEVRFSIAIDSTIYLVGDDAITVATILNELIQNSYDHAFHNQMDSNIVIQCYEEPDAVINLKISDNGGGFEVKRQKFNLGMHIIHSYIKEKLKGQLTITSSHEGTINVIRFLKK